MQIKSHISTLLLWLRSESWDWLFLSPPERQNGFHWIHFSVLHLFRKKKEKKNLFVKNTVSGRQMTLKSNTNMFLVLAAEFNHISILVWNTSWSSQKLCAVERTAGKTLLLWSFHITKPTEADFLHHRILQSREDVRPHLYGFCTPAALIIGRLASVIWRMALMRFSGKNSGRLSEQEMWWWLQLEKHW